MAGRPDDSRSVEFDLRIVRLDAVKKAAYKIGDRCFIGFDLLDENRCRVTLQPKSPSTETDLQLLIGQLQNEALDQELREVVAQETGRVRDLLLAQAFAGLSLIDPTGETASPQDDPLGIRVSS